MAAQIGYFEQRAAPQARPAQRLGDEA